MSSRRTLLLGILVLAVALGLGAVLGRSAVLTPLTAPLLVVLVGGAIAAAAHLVFRRNGEPSK
jgi:hypothetical protein